MNTSENFEFRRHQICEYYQNLISANISEFTVCNVLISSVKRLNFETHHFESVCVNQFILIVETSTPEKSLSFEN